MHELEELNATTFVVPKPNGDFRMVTDYRGLNACILDSAHFTPDSRFSLEQIADNCVFFEFDCVDGFWNVRIGFVLGISARDGRYLFRNRRWPGNALCE